MQPITQARGNRDGASLASKAEGSAPSLGFLKPREVELVPKVTQQEGRSLSGSEPRSSPAPGSIPQQFPPLPRPATALGAVAHLGPTAYASVASQGNGAFESDARSLKRLKVLLGSLVGKDEEALDPPGVGGEVTLRAGTAPGGRGGGLAGAQEMGRGAAYLGAPGRGIGGIGLHHVGP